MALAVQGGDDGAPPDLENLDITACKEKIVQLQAERERRRESTERLQEKLKALNNELAARKEEADRLKKELMGVHHRNREENKKAREQGEAKTDKLSLLGEEQNKNREREKQTDNVRRFIEESLQEQTKGGCERNELGIRTYTETELMVEKPEEEQEKEASLIDTVLITYNLPNTELRYNLSYRVDSQTKSSALREDACLFWGISEVEFILKTEDNSKVHDDLTCQSCFKRDEVAHLFLSQKTPKNQAMLDTEREAIKARIGKDARKKVTKSAENQQTNWAGSGNDLAEQMKAVPGLYQFMTQRDQNAIDHLERIRLRNLLLYFLLCALTILSYSNVRVPSHEYYCRYGPLSAMTHHRYDEVNQRWIPAFGEIRSDTEAWLWLQNAVPNELFLNESVLRKDNILPGWVQIRMQQVGPDTREECMSNGVKEEDVPLHVRCTPEEYNEVTAGKDPMERIRRYWEGYNINNTTIRNDSQWWEEMNYSGVAGQDGRSTDAKPWSYVDSAKQAEVGVVAEPGTLQRFNSGGYVANYDLQPADLNATYNAIVQDMQMFQQLKWVSNRTRSVSVNFMAYNGNFDIWVSCFFLLEYSVVGMVFPRHDITLYSPFTMSTDDGLTQLIYDAIRMGAVLYILGYQIYWEIKYEHKKKKTAWNYIFGQMGICDIGSLILFLAIFTTRFLLYGEAGYTLSDEFTTVQSKFYSLHGFASWFKLHTILEAPLLILLVTRLFTQLRFIRQTFILYRAICDSVYKYSHFALTLIPVMVGFIAVSHTTWSGHEWEHRSFLASTTSVLMDLYGRTKAEHETNKPWTLMYLITFYCISFLIFINGWVAVLVHTYQQTRVNCGYKPQQYRWREFQWINWCLCYPFKYVYLQILRPHTSQPKTLNDEDD